MDRASSLLTETPRPPPTPREVGEAETQMSREGFYNSLFEVVDIWTIDIDVDEYTGFLEALYERITIDGSKTKRGSRKGQHSGKGKNPYIRRWKVTDKIISLQVSVLSFSRLSESVAPRIQWAADKTL